MREILFRGKCVDTGVWYEGGYIHLHKTTHCPIGDPERFPNNDINQIVFERMTDWELPNQHLRVDVNPETVGQFTGLIDKNGKKIFEGDIIKAIASNPVGEDIEATVIVSIDDYELMWDIEHSHEIEVIGNIHDNPELLEGGDS